MTRWRTREHRCIQGVENSSARVKRQSTEFLGRWDLVWCRFPSAKVATDPLLLPVLLMATTAFCRWRWIAASVRRAPSTRLSGRSPACRFRISGATFAPRLGERHERQHALPAPLLSRSRLFSRRWLPSLHNRYRPDPRRYSVFTKAREMRVTATRNFGASQPSHPASRRSLSHPSETSRSPSPNSGPSAEAGGARSQISAPGS